MALESSNSNILVTNVSSNQHLKDYNYITNAGSYSLYISGNVNIYKSEYLQIAYLGYIQPRNSIIHRYSNLNIYEVIEDLYKKHGSRFIEYVKGVFILVVCNKNKLFIYSDHFSLYKAFIYEDKGAWAFTTSLNALMDLGLDLVYEYKILPLYSLLNAIPGNRTIFKNVLRFESASCILIGLNRDTSISCYWDYRQLIEYSNREKIELNDFSTIIDQNFSNLINYQEHRNHLITLTGGKDSRTGLAALIKNNVKPVSVTYGNPNSKDAIYAKSTADLVGIQHKQYYPEDNQDYYHDTLNKIISIGDPDISLHRGHRLYAFSEIVEEFGDSTVLYGGHMGGELLMGLYYDGLIITEYLENFIKTGNIGLNNFRFEKLFHSPKDIDKDYLLDYIHALNTFKSSNVKDREFNAMFEFAIPHHRQDIYLIMKSVGMAYPFFLDIDFLELLFKSDYSFLNMESRSKNLFKRYDLYSVNIHIQNSLCMQMNSIPFGKRGSYSVNDYLKGRYIWSLKRSINYLIESQRKYPPNYLYSNAFVDFVRYQLKKIRNSINEEDHFNIDAAISDLSNLSCSVNELQLKPFTNLLMMNLYRDVKN